jgi:hypothetical protein
MIGNIQGKRESWSGAPTMDYGGLSVKENMSRRKKERDEQGDQTTVQEA